MGVPNDRHGIKDVSATRGRTGELMQMKHISVQRTITQDKQG